VVYSLFYICFSKPLDCEDFFKKKNNKLKISTANHFIVDDKEVVSSAAIVLKIGRDACIILLFVFQTKKWTINYFIVFGQ
jgi:hypothetical protein